MTIISLQQYTSSFNSHWKATRCNSQLLLFAPKAQYLVAQHDSHTLQQRCTEYLGVTHQENYNNKSCLENKSCCGVVLMLLVALQFTHILWRPQITYQWFTFFPSRTPSDTTCPCTAALCAFRTREQEKAPGGCWTQRGERVESHLAAELPPWTTTVSLPRAEEGPQRKRYSPPFINTILTFLTSICM